MIIFSYVKNKEESSCHMGKSRHVPSKTASGTVELELGLTWNIQVNFTKIVVSVPKNTFGPSQVTKRQAQPYKSFGLAKTRAPRGWSAVELWEALLLYFSVRGRRGERY